jgi:hypothetical protein
MSHKITQKQIISLSKKRFDLFVIQPDGTRGTHYGNVNFITAFNFMANNAKCGNRVVVLPNSEDFKTAHGKSVYQVLGYGVCGGQTDPSFGEKIVKYAFTLPFGLL